MHQIKEFLEFKNCNICKNKRYKILYNWKAGYYNHSKYTTYSWDGGSLLICK